MNAKKLHLALAMKNLIHREKFRPRIARDFTRHSATKVLELERPGKFVAGKPSDRPTGHSTYRSLDRRDAQSINKRAAQPFKCATAAAAAGQSILGHQRRWDRPKLAGSFEGIKWDI